MTPDVRAEVRGLPIELPAARDVTDVHFFHGLSPAAPGIAVDSSDAVRTSAGDTFGAFRAVAVVASSLFAAVASFFTVASAFCGCG